MGILTQRSGGKPTKAEFRVFYSETFRPLAAHLRKLGVPSTDLDDLLQETYTEAYKSWGSLQERNKALAWLITIGRRRFFRYLDERKAAKQECLHDEANSSQMEDKRSDTVEGENLILLRESCRDILKVINSLQPDAKRVVVRLYYLEETPIPEIATATGVNVSTITTWLSRFRTNLKDVGRSKLQRTFITAKRRVT